MCSALDGDVRVCDSRSRELAQSAEVERVIGTDAGLTATLEDVLQLFEDGVLQRDVREYLAWKNK